MDSNKTGDKKRLFLIAIEGFAILLVLGSVLFLFSEFFSKSSKDSRFPKQVPPTRHIIWISFDALRADHLDFYGYPLHTAPNLARWADRAIIFDRCVSQGVCTIFSTNTMLFGHMYRTDHSMTGQLVHAGYETALFSNHGVFPIKKNFTTILDNGSLTEEELASMALAWQKERADQKTFLWIHFLSPHLPQPKSGEHFEQILAKRMNLDIFPPAFYHFPESEENPDKFIVGHKAWAAYDAGIAKSDRGLELFLDGIMQGGILKDSLVVFTADHGQAINNEGFLYHMHYTFRGLVHVPLLIFLPEVAKENFGKARRLQYTARHVDLAPTTLEAAQIDIKQMNFQGVSLWRVLDGTKSESPLPFSDGSGNGFPISRSIEDGKYVLWKIYNEDKISYKQFVIDRFGNDIEKNFQATYPNKFWKMKKLLDAIPHPEIGNLWTDDNLSENEKARLKELGYL